MTGQVSSVSRSLLEGIDRAILGSNLGDLISECSFEVDALVFTFTTNLCSTKVHIYIVQSTEIPASVELRIQLIDLMGYTKCCREPLDLIECLRETIKQYCSGYLHWRLIKTGKFYEIRGDAIPILARKISLKKFEVHESRESRGCQEIVSILNLVRGIGFGFKRGNELQRLKDQGLI